MKHGIGTYLQMPLRDRRCRTAWDLVEDIEDLYWRDAAMNAVIYKLEELHSENAVTYARTAAQVAARPWLVESAVEFLSRNGGAPEAYALSIEKRLDGRFLVYAALGLPSAQRSKAIHMANAVARKNKSSFQKTQELWLITRVLAEAGEIEKARSLAYSIEDENHKNQALTEIINTLSSMNQFDKAWELSA